MINLCINQFPLAEKIIFIVGCGKHFSSVVMTVYNLIKRLFLSVDKKVHSSVGKIIALLNISIIVIRLAAYHTESLNNISLIIARNYKIGV